MHGSSLPKSDMCSWKYNVFQLLEMVESRPCLWDRSEDSYKDRIEKSKAWNEICKALDPEYPSMNKQQQYHINQLIIGKWQNIRDSFIKSLKKNGVKRYLYHDYLQFLLKTISRDETSQSYNMEMTAAQESLQLESEDNYQEEVETYLDTEHEVKDISNDSFKPRKRQRVNQDLELSERERTWRPDADEAFFMSVTPSLKRMSEDEKLEFRIGVLQLLKDINNRRQESLQPRQPGASFSGTLPRSSPPSQCDSVCQQVGPALPDRRAFHFFKTEPDSPPSNS